MGSFGKKDEDAHPYHFVDVLEGIDDVGCFPDDGGVEVCEPTRKREMNMYKQGGSRGSSGAWRMWKEMAGESLLNAT